MTINRLRNLLRPLTSAARTPASRPNPNFVINRIGSSGAQIETQNQKMQGLRLNNLHSQSKKMLTDQFTTSFNMPIESKAEIFDRIDKGDFSAAKKKTASEFNASSEIGASEKEAGFNKKFISQLESKGWDNLNTTIEAQGRDFTNELTPYNNLDLHINGVNKNIYNDAVNKHQGISCYSTNDNPHAANLWHSSLKNQNGEEIFSAIRHASLSYRPTDNANKQSNQQIVKEKVKELVTAALYSKHKAELERRVSLGNNAANEPPLKLKMSSTSLLTLLDLQFGPVHESEESQFFQQKQALDELQQELTEITIDGVPIPVQLEAITFSAGVNNFALGASTIYNLMNGNSWKKADEINRESLVVLLGDLKEDAPLGGWAKECIDGLSDSLEDQLKKKKIEVLVQDLRYIFANKLHHSENNERYAFPKRLAYLAYLVDAVPSFNCKSGKDRTGMVDAEVKALAATLESQTDLFMPNEDLSTVVPVDTLRAFHLDASNFEIQRLNSGLSGNKALKKDSEYFNTIFTPEQLALIKGMV